MNSLFFNKTKSQEENNNIQDIDVADVMESEKLCSAVCNLTGNDVLVLKTEYALESASIANSQNCERLQPFYFTGSNIKTNSTKVDFGFTLNPSQTLNMQRNATRQAKWVYVNYLKLLTQINNLINHAPNQSVKNDLNSIKQETIISTTIISNIIRAISHNQNPRLAEFSATANNKAFCTELKNAINTLNIILVGLIRVNRMINVSQINNQIFILLLSAQNIKSNLNSFQIYC